jgi:plasmid stabilization system protein ParE
MPFFTVITTEFALDDLEKGRAFYEMQAPKLGDYFYDTLIADIESLRLYAGIHVRSHGFYKLLSKRFPYTLYYDIPSEQTARVVAILDQRRQPMYHYQQLAHRSKQ